MTDPVWDVLTQLVDELNKEEGWNPEFLGELKEKFGSLIVWAASRFVIDEALAFGVPADELTRRILPNLVHKVEPSESDLKAWHAFYEDFKRPRGRGGRPY